MGKIESCDRCKNCDSTEAAAAGGGQVVILIKIGNEICLSQCI